MPQFFGEISTFGEIDTYNVTLVAGVTYYFELEGAANGAGTLEDGFLSLYQGGNLITFNDDGGVGLNSRIAYTATQSGTYQLQAEGFASFYTGTYRLNAFQDDARNSVEGIGAAPFIETGLEATGTVNYAGDHDVFSVALIAGLTYRIEERGASSGEGSLSDPLLRILDASDTVLAEDDDSGGFLDSRINFVADNTQTYYIDAGAFGDSGTGSYTVHVFQGVGTNFADTISGTGRGDAISGAGGGDTISGNGGNDILRGASGNDTITGGAGLDVLIGGTGNDTFDFNGAGSGFPDDTIRGGDGATAFQGAGGVAGDRIDLSDIDANVGAGGNQAFIFGGTGAGRLSLVNAGTDTIVRGNIDGDAVFEFQARIEDGAVLASTYTAADFIL